MVFLYISNIWLVIGIFNAFSSCQKTTYLEINLTKDVQDFEIENCKTLWKKLNKD